MRLIKGITVIASLIFAQVSFSEPPPPPPPSFWNDTTLTFDWLENRITNTHCYENEQTFIACVQSINAIFDHLEENIILISHPHFSAVDGFGSVVHDFGAMKVVENQSLASTNIIELFRFDISERRRGFDFWRQLYQWTYLAPRVGNRSPLEADFSEILSWVRGTFVSDRYESEITAAAINGYLASAFDPHTLILPRSYYENSMLEHQPRLGIGVFVRKIANVFYLWLVDETGPAFAAGFRPYDVITHINDRSVEGLRVGDVSQQLQGPVGSHVGLTVLRQNTPFTAVVTRENVVIHPILYGLFQDRQHSVGYIKLSTFIGGREEFALCNAVSQLLSELQTNANIEGVIFDLRNNRGGYVTEAACLSSLFLPRNQILLSIENLDSSERYRWTSSIDGTPLPLVLLMNSQSASGSEIMAGALQDHQRAFIVGERSYGKGSAQIVEPWQESPEDVVIFRTQARFFLPSGRTNQIFGIIPDFAVYQNPNPTDYDRFALREEDYYTNVLPAVGEPWEQPRPIEIHRLQTCTESSGLASERFASLQGHTTTPDYPLLYGQDLMTCLLTP